MHNIKSGGKEKAVDVNELIKAGSEAVEGTKSPGKSQVVWRKSCDKTLLCLGCDDGTVEIYLVPGLTLLLKLKSHSKLIQSLSWYPTHFTGGQPGKHPGWLATASSQNNIHVYDLAAFLKTEGGLDW